MNLFWGGTERSSDRVTGARKPRASARGTGVRPGGSPGRPEEKEWGGLYPPGTLGRRGTPSGSSCPGVDDPSALPGPSGRRQGLSQIRPRVRGDYPPNLSILLSGGKETNRDSPSKCDRTGRSPACSLEPPFPGARGMPRSGGSPSRVPAQLSPLERGHYPWRVRGPYALSPGPWNGPSVESGCLKLQPKAGGKLHLRLNITTSPIANKYREGKLKRTLKREFKSA